MKKRLRKKRHRGEFAPKPAQLLTAYQRIQAERQRQVSVEGWSEAHDDAHHDGALVAAATVYAARSLRAGGDVSVPEGWPWGAQYWKPTPGNWERELEKAGALLQAEIDRHGRVLATVPPKSYLVSPRGHYNLLMQIKLREEQAAIEARLNELALHRCFPTGPTCALGPDPGQRLVPYIGYQSDAARVVRGLAQLGPGWHHYRRVTAEGKFLHLVAESAGPGALTYFEATWQFDYAGRLVRFSCAQRDTKVPHNFPSAS